MDFFVQKVMDAARMLEIATSRLEYGDEASSIRLCALANEILAPFNLQPTFDASDTTYKIKMKDPVEQETN